MNEKEYYVTQMNQVQVSKKMQEQVLQFVNRRKINYWKQISIAVAVMAIFVLFVIPSPLSDQVKAYCEIAIYGIDEMIYGKHTDVSEYTTNVVQTDTDGDLSVQLNEVLLDGSHLILNYTVSSTKPRFYTIEDATGGTYEEGYYDIGIRKITINGKSKTYSKDEIMYDASVMDSTDSYTYPVEGEHCLCDFKEVLENPEEILDIQLDVVAMDFEEGNEKHFSYAFTIKNRELQLETKEIPMNQVLQQDDITFTFDKMCINSYSQKVYFYVTGLPDNEYGKALHAEENPYFFSLEGIDNDGNKVFASIEEIRNGYGYFELHPYSDAVALNYNVQYYDMQLEYDWDDPTHVICDDAEEGIWYGKSGNVGELFRISCKE